MTFAEDITARRADTAFTDRLHRSIGRNRRALERLSQGPEQGEETPMVASPSQRRQLHALVVTLPWDDCADSFVDTAPVADFFRERGIRGRSGGPCSCPVAQYLSAAMGVDVMVDGRDASIIGDGYAVRLPSNVRSFIADFDQGLYPDLQLGAEPLTMLDRIRLKLMDAPVPLRKGAPAWHLTRH